MQSTLAESGITDGILGKPTEFTLVIGQEYSTNGYLIKNYWVEFPFYYERFHDAVKQCFEEITEPTSQTTLQL